jgi:hypothetical protein
LNDLKKYPENAADKKWKVVPILLLELERLLKKIQFIKSYFHLDRRFRKEAVLMRAASFYDL